MDKKPHKQFLVSQWVMLVHKDTCLLVKNSRRGMWELPGGRIDDEETDFEQAMRREILEEAGIERFDIIGQVGWEPVLAESGFYTVRTITLGKVTSADVTLSHEHTEYAWVTREQVGDFDVEWKKIPELLKKGFDIYDRQ